MREKLGDEEKRQENEAKRNKSEQMQTQPKETKPTPQPSESYKCLHNFGYLGQLSNRKETPDECMMCKKLIECMFSKPGLTTSLSPAPSFQPAPSKSMPSMHSEPVVEEKNVKETVEKIEKPVNPQAYEALEKLTAEEDGEPEAPKQQITNLPSQQFVVDKFGGFLVRSDTVQIDSDVLQRWSSMIDGKEISEADVETSSGRIARCRIKVISDKKLLGTGVIRIPEELCEKLELNSGERIRVKPVVPKRKKLNDAPGFSAYDYQFQPTRGYQF